MLSVRDVILFLGGQRQAIERVCGSRWALLVGALLVGTAVISRNYDNAAILYEPRRIVMPFVFSVVSSLFLFAFLYWRFRYRSVEPKPAWSWQYLSILGAFWMTAPIAWLYAIPVERWMDPIPAVRANGALLLVVSIWRVLLISRVASVIAQASYFTTLIYVVVAASFEFVVVGVAMTFSNVSHGIAESMAGLQSSPAVQAAAALNRTMLGSALLAAIISTMIAIGLRRHCRRPFPEPVVDGFPGVVVSGVLVILVGASILVAPHQRAEMRWHRLENMIHARDYGAALDYVEDLGRETVVERDSLPFDPWSYRAVRRYPEFLPHLEGRPAWIRELYFENALVLVERLQYDVFAGGMMELLEEINELPEGRVYFREHSDRLRQVAKRIESESLKTMLDQWQR